MIDEIILQMEGQDLPLDQILAKYEQGVELIEHCQGKLAAAEKHMTLLTQKHSIAQSVSRLPEDASQASVEENAELQAEEAEPPHLF